MMRFNAGNASSDGGVKMKRVNIFVANIFLLYERIRSTLLYIFVITTRDYQLFYRDNRRRENAVGRKKHDTGVKSVSSLVLSVYRRDP